jgi:hypothetical protein
VRCLPDSVRNLVKKIFAEPEAGLILLRAALTFHHTFTTSTISHLPDAGFKSLVIE